MSNSGQQIDQEMQMEILNATIQELEAQRMLMGTRGTQLAAEKAQLALQLKRANTDKVNLSQQVAELTEKLAQLNTENGAVADILDADEQTAVAGENRAD